MKYIILIPAFEPDMKLLKLLKEIDNKYPVVVINDGSSKLYDNIFKQVKKYAHVISYKENMGKGYALKTGFNYIDDMYKNYIIVTMDADGQHTVSDAINLCEFVNNNQDVLALGKRKFNHKMPLRSRIGNFITRKIFKKVTKMNIYDTQTGLRAFSYKLIDYMLNTSGYRYEYEINALLYLKDNNIKYCELPIETIYFDHNRSSHFNSLIDSYLVYKCIFKYKKNRSVNNGR